MPALPPAGASSSPSLAKGSGSHGFAAPNMARGHAIREYRCDCARFCHSKLATVGKATFYAHAEFRTPDSRGGAWKASSDGSMYRAVIAPRKTKNSKKATADDAAGAEGQDGSDVNIPVASSSGNNNTLAVQPEAVTRTADFNSSSGAPHTCNSSHQPLDSLYAPAEGRPLLPATVATENAPLEAVSSASQPSSISTYPDHVASVEPRDIPSQQATAASRSPSVRLEDHPDEDDDGDDVFSLGQRTIDEGSTSNGEDLPSENLGLPPESDVPLEDLNTSMRFIEALKNATLADDKLEDHIREQLRNPTCEELDIDSDILRLSLNIYIGMDNASNDHYNVVRDALMQHNPPIQLLSYDQVKRAASRLSGVTAIYEDMCVDSCVAFTGPFKDLEQCPTCHQDRYEFRFASAQARRRKKIARRQFLTIPIGPQIQALYRSPQGALAMRYRRGVTAKILSWIDDHGGAPWQVPQLDDYVFGTEYLDGVLNGTIEDTDTILMLSLDGAQLYAHKQSDCWVYIWVVLDHAPEVRYRKKHVLIGGIFPGPNKPKNIDSFLFPGIYHLAALMNDGLHIWDAVDDTVFVSKPFVAFACADGPGMTYLNGQVGHMGALGCRLYCDQKGRLKPGTSHYYPAALRPIRDNIQGSEHATINLRERSQNFDYEAQRARYNANLNLVLSSRTTREYKDRRRETGIAKPSLFFGLPSHRIYPLPGCFPADIMHLVSLNLPDLILKLWRGTFDCDKKDDKRAWAWVCLTGDTWKIHGQAVADTRYYLPGCFDRPPRNPAEKISSGYKAIEYLTYLFGLGPALLRGILPEPFWNNYCKLVRGIRLLQQRHITITEITEAHKFLIEFSEEFEALYYQGLPERLHFIRQSIHALFHMAPETVRIGPYLIFAQWVLERLIGQLVKELRQPSNPQICHICRPLPPAAATSPLSARFVTHLFGLG